MVTQFQIIKSLNADNVLKIRYLHGRCVRLESWRKALVWQKRYLQRVLAGYQALELRLQPPARPPSPRARLRRAVTAVMAALRMRFLVRRRQHARALAAACLLHGDGDGDRDRDRDHAPVEVSGTSPPSRGPPATPQGTPRGTPGGTPRDPSGTPRGASVGAGLARRVLKQEMKLNLPASPGLAEFTRRSPLDASSPREDPFILSSPRGEAAAAYLSKLELVGRCLSQAGGGRDVTRGEAPAGCRQGRQVIFDG